MLSVWVCLLREEKDRERPRCLRPVVDDGGGGEDGDDEGDVWYGVEECVAAKACVSGISIACRLVFVFVLEVGNEKELRWI